MNIFVTGTDTDVGKTVVSAWICHWTKAKYWKPIQTGSETDVAVIKKISPNTEIIETLYTLKAPLSPYNAAKLENVEIAANNFQKNIPDKTVIEGAGGLLVPIADNFQMLDLVECVNAKVLIVAKSKLGFLNHIFMTVEMLKSRNLDILGIILNGETEPYLIETIEKFSGQKVLATLPQSNSILELVKNTKLPSTIKLL